MKKFFCAFLLLGLLVACDLQPHIVAIPGDVGEFISSRYPTLLAEPDSDIYKTAVADYGMYASPTLYGNGDITGQDYVLYSPTDDYMMPAQDTDVDDADVGMPDIESGGTEDDDVVSGPADEYGFAPDGEIDDLVIPDYETQDLIVSEYVAPKPETKEQPKPTDSDKKMQESGQPVARARVNEITVEKGDTLYSLSRKYSVPVNDLAVMNKIAAPFTLSVGQKLKVPDIAKLENVQSATTGRVAVKKTVVKKVEPVKTSAPTTSATSAKKTTVKSGDTKNVEKSTVKKTTTGNKSNTSTAKQDTKKTDVKSDADKKTVKQKSDNKSTKKMPQTTKKTTAKKSTTNKMVARSSSRFSWPVRGKILSGYGSKSNGLFNDGINISATRGATVAAAENGLVAYAGNEVKGMGNLVIIQHSDGWMTVYAHMDSFVVKRGAAVRVGQKIGTVGMSGKVDQPQLHFEIRKGTRAYNPIDYLKK